MSTRPCLRQPGDPASIGKHRSRLPHGLIREDNHRLRLGSSSGPSACLWSLLANPWGFGSHGIGPLGLHPPSRTPPQSPPAAPSLPSSPLWVSSSSGLPTPRTPCTPRVPHVYVCADAPWASPTSLGPAALTLLLPMGKTHKPSGWAASGSALKPAPQSCNLPGPGPCEGRAALCSGSLDASDPVCRGSPSSPGGPPHRPAWLRCKPRK